MSVPTVDCTLLLSINAVGPNDPISDELFATCDALGRAFEHCGFAIAVNHGVRCLAQVEDAAKEFFSLEKGKKEEISMDLNPTYRGYKGIGGETTMGVADYKETLDFGTNHLEPESEKLSPFLGRNQYSRHVSGLEAAAEQYHMEMEQFGRAVMRGLAVYLGLPLDSMTCGNDKKTTNHLYRFLKYPPAPKDRKGRIQGIGEHTDYGCLAMLFATGGGLEVKDTSGNWIPAPFIKDAIVVNVGDMIETWTNGAIKATWHRVMHENDFTRYSFPFFYEPSFTSVIRPLGLFGKSKEEYDAVVYADHVRKGTAKSFPNHHSSKQWLDNNNNNNNIIMNNNNNNNNVNIIINTNNNNNNNINNNINNLNHFDKMNNVEKMLMVEMRERTLSEESEIRVVPGTPDFAPINNINNIDNLQI